jgi:hypothetical protein
MIKDLTKRIVTKKLKKDLTENYIDKYLSITLLNTPDQRSIFKDVSLRLLLTSFFNYLNF